MGLLSETPDAGETEWPVVLPDGNTAYCRTDEHGRIDPRAAYAPWLTRKHREPPRT
jgi:hypothetical protein